ncbi:hypothetical protein HELRODRAFT_143594, partial [Helobdella robusta]|uniref:BTB domain-containing protein n=1 Tax=Helobdella robusta TaxID=6412 RepID=T1EJA9_HELRO
MLEHEIACDVVFILNAEDGSAYEMKAHKYILISRNPVFYAMLMNDTRDKSEKITITDVLPNAFKALLNFLYSENCQITPDLVLPILYASKKYIIPKLAKNCVKFLEENMNNENVCLIYDHCLMFEETELAKKCEKFLEINTENVLKPQIITTLSESALKNLLKLPVVSVSEISLFNACLVWGKNECKKKELDSQSIEHLRAILKDILLYIHFPSMTNEEFAEVSRTSLLNPEERLIFFNYKNCNFQKLNF